MLEKIQLIVTSFNSLSQRVFCALQDKGYTLSITYALSEENMQKEVQEFNPDLIICPYLMQKIPENIYNEYTTIIIHPGPIGDRGSSSLDLAILNQKNFWGITYLQANDKLDGGDIWTSKEFIMREASKSSLYRNEVANCTIELLDEILVNYENKTFKPKPQNTFKNIHWNVHNPLKQNDRKIDWNNDLANDIIRKINSADSNPGLLDELLGVKCYLFGANIERTLNAKPKEIVAKRDGAICIGCIDKAIWISHLKEVDKFKLPATYVLKDKLKGIKEVRIPLYVNPDLETFKEITFEKKDNIGYLSFDFYNGAMSAQQCIRLKYAIDSLKDEVEILVLKGGKNFFSNGINLNILEDSEKQGEDGWSNINAINNLIKSIIYCEDIITIASFEANAGAGGVFLALACDFCVAKEGIVLNPHYKTIGLNGSEYHTYTFFKKVDKKLAQNILEKALPISAQHAKKINMIDEIFPTLNYEYKLEKYCIGLFKDDYERSDFIDKKNEYLEKNKSYIDTCKENELKKMYPQFWDINSEFHRLRHEFVYKIAPNTTPSRLKEI